MSALSGFLRSREPQEFTSNCERFGDEVQPASATTAVVVGPDHDPEAFALGATVSVLHWAVLGWLEWPAESDIAGPRSRTICIDCFEVRRLQPEQSVCLFKCMDNVEIACQVFTNYLVHPAHAVKVGGWSNKYTRHPRGKCRGPMRY